MEEYEQFLKSLPGFHLLKIKPEYLESIADGSKTFEIRKNDRNFCKGDRLILAEYVAGRYTNRIIVVDIVYITDFEQKEEYCVLGIEPSVIALGYVKSLLRGLYD
ncbi:hypothetical protein EA94_01183 [Enterococcus faecalis]|uniref:DUF3850 domain-containing protein n=1 Tax=Enterococcus faecalis TaxID=1351 RepID=UPI000DE9CB20|nr:DUF3850 domain-containing protein [Enterococcus faecalis]RBS17149.1 hypothetical protein EA94_01183 [Enterococcus faecalis]